MSRAKPVKAGEQGEMVVAHVNGRSGEQGANARLIAALPDLLAACEYIAKNGDVLNGEECAELAREAIAKATGEP